MLPRNQKSHGLICIPLLIHSILNNLLDLKILSYKFLQKKIKLKMSHYARPSDNFSHRSMENAGTDLLEDIPGKCC